MVIRFLASVVILTTLSSIVCTNNVTAQCTVGVCRRDGVVAYQLENPGFVGPIPAPALVLVEQPAVAVRPRAMWRGRLFRRAVGLRLFRGRLVGTLFFRRCR